MNFPWFKNALVHNGVSLQKHFNQSHFPVLSISATIVKLTKKRRFGTLDDDSDDDDYNSLSLAAVLRALKKTCPTDTTGPRLYKMLYELNDPDLNSVLRVHTNWATVSNAAISTLSRSVFCPEKWCGIILQIAGMMLQRQITLRKQLHEDEALLRQDLDRLSESGRIQAAEWATMIIGISTTLFYNLNSPPFLHF